MKIRIMVVDDHAIVRECLCSILERCDELEVAGQAGDGVEAVRMARDVVPDVVVMDVGMEGMNGIDATLCLASGSPGVKVLMVSMHNERRILEESLRAGARGFVLKSAPAAELIKAIKTVAAGGRYISPELGAIGQRQPNGGEVTLEPLLTEREREVLVLLASGRKSKEIATILDISAKTVESHRAHIMKKLGLNNIADLTRYALREGLLAS
ncbi:response regulator transcription factor [Geomonas sp. Red32]|uniref:response regulator n=1 Tax=Geomonas sp. Red32 TaxID=2912856 RepID=UPI00202CCCE4|nr:response regulator transcription factor [Geomonas sp. Red32]MCM0082436.1 response regulator transcription factor [Geomonas sp. Red32]